MPSRLRPAVPPRRCGRAGRRPPRSDARRRPGRARSGAGLAASAVRSGAINSGATRARHRRRGAGAGGPPRDRRRTRTPARSGRPVSAASSTPLRAAAARSRPSARSHALERLQLVAQLGRLLEALIRAQRRHPHPQARTPPCRRPHRAASRRPPPPSGRTPAPRRRRGTARRTGPAARPGSCRRPPAAAGRQLRSRNDERIAAAAACASPRLRSGPALMAPGRGSDGDGYPRHPLVGGQRQVAAALGVDRAAVRIRPQPQDQLQLEQRRLQLAAQRPRLDARGRLQGVLHRRAAARSRRSTSARARAGRWPCPTYSTRSWASWNR